MTVDCLSALTKSHRELKLPDRAGRKSSNVVLVAKATQAFTVVGHSVTESLTSQLLAKANSQLEVIRPCYIGNSDSENQQK